MSYHQLNQQIKSSRKVYAVDGQIREIPSSSNPNNIPDHSLHHPYIPTDGDDLKLNYGNLEPSKKKLKERDFLDENSQLLLTSDSLQVRPVSTGLGLSINDHHADSLSDVPFLTLIGHDIDRVLREEEAEIDKFIKAESNRMREAILEKVQARHLQTLSYVEGKIYKKLNEKEAEVENLNRKNTELERQIEQKFMEACAWQQQAQHTENVIASLKLYLEQANANGKDSKEGCGDSEVDDTACNGNRAVNFRMLFKEHSDDFLTCKFCRVNKACMLLFPCKHLCLCKICESKLGSCPLCRLPKSIGMEVYM